MAFSWQEPNVLYNPPKPKSCIGTLSAQLSRFDSREVAKLNWNPFASSLLRARFVNYCQSSSQTDQATPSSLQEIQSQPVEQCGLFVIGHMTRLVQNLQARTAENAVHLLPDTHGN